MKRSRSEKLELVNKYLYRTVVKMFTPNVAREFSYLLEDLTENEQSFSRKIDQAYDSLQDTSHLIERLETELDSKIKNITKLKEEYKRYSELAQIEEGKARALMSQLDISLNKGKVSERIIAFIINIVAGIILFVAGIWASPFVKEFIGITTGT